jgi:ethanolamine utilization protein EutM
MPRPALGLVETSGIEGALKATRAAADSGEVVIVSAEQGTSGRMTVKIEGEWSAVQGAVEAGARAAYDAGELVSMHVIPKSDDEVSAILPYPRFVGRYSPDQAMAAIPKKPAPVRPPVQREASAARPIHKAIVARPLPPIEKTAPPVAVVTPNPPLAQPEPSPIPAAPAAPPSEQPTWEQLEAMAVVKLRQYARGVPDLPIKGRQISIANKDQLLAAIAAIRSSGKV